ncbi:MAG: RNA-binding S4 domain-containing protein [Bacteroidaceae bacterium]|nr:RNA-binding S4 domain-containing protein [Bacteroidaceae bacterium]
MEARIDKWLWAVRLYKTRSMATDACKKGQITMNGLPMKPSKNIKEGDIINVRKPPVTYTFKVLQAIENRVGAKLVPEMLENLTPKEQYEILEMNKISGFINRARGTGRPTKKDRRELDDFQSETPFFFDELSPFDDEDEDDDL